MSTKGAIDEAWGLFGEDDDVPPAVREVVNEEGGLPSLLIQSESKPPKISASVSKAWEIFDGDEDEDDDDVLPAETTSSTSTVPTTTMTSGGASGTSTAARAAGTERTSAALLRAFVEEHVDQTCRDLAEAVGRPDLAEGLQALRRLLMKETEQQDKGEDDHEAAMVARGQEVSEAAWHQLTRGGGWNHVCWREAYVFAQLFIAQALAYRANALESATQSGHDEKLRQAVKHLDMAIIMGGPTALVQALITKIEPIIVAASRASRKSSSMEMSVHMIVNELPQSKSLPSISYPIVREATPTLANFRTVYFDQQKPVVLTGVTEGWRSLSKWRDLSYLEQEYGHRTVPIEVGRPLDEHEQQKGDAKKHAQNKWKERALTLSEFIQTFLLPSSRLDHHRLSATIKDDRQEVAADHQTQELSFEQIGYLAQHALIKQLPTLQADYRVPSYCSLGELSNINTWLGTSGTVTSLHFDSYDNFLTQIAGFKYVRLYHPSQTPNLYRDAPSELPSDKLSDRVDSTPMNEAGNEEMTISEQSAKGQGNFSAVVNIENPDLERYPLLRQAIYTETILGPGEMLFIPRGCWHYVRSLTTSFSLNFWF